MALVVIAPGHSLSPAAAASYARMRADGCPAGITSSTRSRDLQAALRRAWEADPVNNAYAKPPGQSKHEWPPAVALDLKADAASWVRRHPEHGWRFTDPNEWWHAEYVASLDQHRHQPAPALTPEGHPDMLLIKKGASVFTFISGDRAVNLSKDAAEALMNQGGIRLVTSMPVDDIRLIQAAFVKEA